MKNYIGIQDDRHRLIDHDHRLNEKIADLQYIIQPQFIAIDAITAGEGRMLTPIPFPSTSSSWATTRSPSTPCAATSSASIRSPSTTSASPHERGFGPVDLDEISVVGDVTLEEAQARAKGFKVGLIRVEKYFEGTHITAYAGPPRRRAHRLLLGRLPRRHRGGHRDPAPLRRPVRRQDAAHARRLRRLRRPHRREARREGRLHRRLRHLGGRDPRASSCRSAPPTRTARPRTRTRAHDDIFAKMASVMMKLRAAKEEHLVRFEGCPVSVAEQVLMPWSSSPARRTHFSTRREPRLQQGLPAVALRSPWP
jgi:hypothetical protein